MNWRLVAVFAVGALVGALSAKAYDQRKSENSTIKWITVVDEIPGREIFVPGRVTPLVQGNPTGMRYRYYDSWTHVTQPESYVPVQVSNVGSINQMCMEGDETHARSWRPRADGGCYISDAMQQFGQ